MIDSVMTLAQTVDEITETNDNPWQPFVLRTAIGDYDGYVNPDPRWTGSPAYRWISRTAVRSRPEHEPPCFVAIEIT